MRESIARAGLWFFGAIIAFIVFGGQYLKDHTLAEQIGMLVFVAVIVGGAVFFYTWYEHEQEQRILKNRERRLALKKAEEAEDDDAPK